MNQRIELRDFFAANAPARPPSFERLKSYREEIVTTRKDGQNWYQPHTYEVLEEMIDWETRWRYYYADAMIKARKL